MLAPAAKVLGSLPGHSGLLFSAAIIGGINAVGFLATATTKTHKLTDACGTGAFVASAAASAYMNRGSWLARGGLLSRPALLTVAVSLWGARLGIHLFERIMKSPSDPRLDQFIPKKGEKWFESSKSNFPVSLAGFWTIQAAWAWVVSLPVTLAIFNPAAASIPLGASSILAFLGFAGGLTFEAVADYQKRKFKEDPANKGKWIDTGLWSVSRHPNYAGEIAVWISLFAASYPALRGSKQVILGLASPLFVSGLLLYVSGIPMLEEKMDKDYADNAAYKQYKEKTPVLVPYIHLPIPGVPK